MLAGAADALTPRAAFGPGRCWPGRSRRMRAWHSWTVRGSAPYRSPAAVCQRRTHARPGHTRATWRGGQALERLGDAALAYHRVGEVPFGRRLAVNQLALRGLCAVAVNALFLPVQQIGQRMLVVDIGRRDDGATRQARRTVHTDGSFMLKNDCRLCV
jgi:hypothetical protein